MGSIEGRAGAQGEPSPGPWRPVRGALTRPALPLAPAVPLAPSLPFSLRALRAPSPQPLPENTPHLPFLTRVSVGEENRGGSGLVGADSSRFWKFNHHYHHPPHTSNVLSVPVAVGGWGREVVRVLGILWRVLGFAQEQDGLRAPSLGAGGSETGQAPARPLCLPCSQKPVSGRDALGLLSQGCPPPPRASTPAATCV